MPNQPEAGTLKQQTIAGVGWSSIAQIGKQTLQFTITVILMRLLTPQDFGLLGLIVVFTNFAALFGELGFSAALIQREQIEEAHLTSSFWLNLGAGLLLTLLFLLLAPALAAFYGEPRLRELTGIVALTFVISAAGVVPSALLQRRMAFRQLARAELGAVILSGGVAIWLALSGYGVWSLAWQLVLASALTVAALWRATGWRPRLAFQRAAVQELMGFSGNLLGYNVFNYWARNADNFLIGRFLGTASLGIYARAYSTMLLPLTQVTNVLGRVMFPVLSRVQGDRVRVKRIYLRAVGLIALITFPLMLGLFVVSEHFVLALYGPKWYAVAGVLPLFCLVGMSQSLVATSGWLYQSQGRTDLMFRWIVGAGSLAILSFLIGIKLGTIEAVAACYALLHTFLLYWSIAIPGRLIGLTFGEVARSVAGTLACAGAMAAGVWGLGLLLPPSWPHWAFLLVQVAAGALLYAALLHLFKLDAYHEMRALLREQVERRRLRPTHPGEEQGETP